MPILIKRETKQEQPEFKYTFELNKEERKIFFDEFLKDFFDKSLLGDLELRDTKVEFSMNLHKKEVEEDILID
jgi:hypothetical protein